MTETTLLREEDGLRPFRLELSVSRVANMQYFEMPSHYATRTGSHRFRELIFADSGEVTVKSPDYSGRLRKNELLIHRAHTPHSLSCHDVAPNLIIIGLECESARLDAFSRRPYALSADLQKMLVELVKEGRNVYLPPYDLPNRTAMQTREDFPFGADQLIKNLLECFLIKLIREEGAEKAAGGKTAGGLRTGEVARYLENNFLEKITITELCFLFGTNKTTLTKDFHRLMGMTVTEYIAHLRLREAKRLLREGTANVTEIAERLNFSSVHYFTRFFTKHEKMSPSAYAGSIRARFEEDDK